MNVTSVENLLSSLFESPRSTYTLYANWIAFISIIMHSAKLKIWKLMNFDKEFQVFPHWLT